MRISFISWPILPSLEYITLYGSSLLFNKLLSSVLHVYLWKRCTYPFFPADFHHGYVSLRNEWKASVFAVLHNHFNIWELFVEHSACSMPCYTSSFPTPFYIMSVSSRVFRKKRKINILPQTAMLRLQLPSSFKNREFFWILKPFL